MTPHVLDLFAGTGWGVACQRLGLLEHGGEIMREAVQSRWLNGMLTPYGDVSLITGEQAARYPIHLGSPPCQTYSAAGSGKGRQMLDRVLTGVQAIACGWPWHPTDGDPRTWLVLEPLRLALAGRPMLIAWEQVPAVLPVWEACADVLRQRGYSVWTGMLQAEMYGVPQTRKRAVLLARRDGKRAAPPTPTHSRYYTRDPSRLDPGVLPWVSMAQALGWGGGTVVSNYGTGGDPADRGERTSEQPAATVTGKAGRNRWVYRNGNQAHTAERPIDTSVPMVHFGARSNAVDWIWRSNYTGTGQNSTPSPIEGSPPLGKRELDQPIATLTANAGHWVNRRPATTVQGDPRIAAVGHHERQMENSIRVSVAEAACLQTYPAGFRFAGSGGAQYQQIGNAVPPLLAEAILLSLLD